MFKRIKPLTWLKRPVSSWVQSQMVFTEFQPLFRRSVKMFAVGAGQLNISGLRQTGVNNVPEFVLIRFEPLKKNSFYTSRIVRAKFSDRAINFCQYPSFFKRQTYSICLFSLMLSTLIKPCAKLRTSFSFWGTNWCEIRNLLLAFWPKTCQWWRRILYWVQNSLGIAKCKS